MTREEKILLLIMGNLFIELRALEKAPDYDVIRRIADLFHNLPFTLQGGGIRENHTEYWEYMLSRADELGIGSEWLQSMWKIAEKSLQEPLYRDNS